jgi:hypothetical protein
MRTVSICGAAVRKNTGSADGRRSTALLRRGQFADPVQPILRRAMPDLALRRRFVLAGRSHPDAINLARRRHWLPTDASRNRRKTPAREDCRFRRLFDVDFRLAPSTLKSASGANAVTLKAVPVNCWQSVQ